ncbi:putative ankyrin repeat protein [Armadillidium vulgare]|nr:putative ankyrin repeat protein [Armadillidium vulgare]
MFVDLAGGIEELESAVELLKQHSIVNLLEQNPTMLNISEPTQQVIRTILKEENKEEVTLRKALQLFQIGLESDNLDHAISTWCYASAYQELIEKFCMLPSGIVRMLGDCGRYEEAYSFGIEPLKVIKFSNEAPLCLRYEIGNVLLKQRKFEEALRICEDSTGCYRKDVKVFLCHAAEDGNLEAVKFLVENKGTDDKIYCSKSLMHCAVQGNNLEVVKFLVEEKGVSFNSSNLRGVLPIHYASERSNLDIVKFLVEKGADFNSIDNTRRTSVHYAAKQSNSSIVEFFVERGADFMARDDDLETPLHYAAEGGNLDVVRFLVEKGADINSTAKGGIVPLHYAAEGGNLNVVEFLLEEGADFCSMDNCDRTSVHYAAKQSNSSIIEFFVEEGDDFMAQDSDLKTPLHYAAKGGNLDVVKFLVEKGADVNSTDRDGRTPLHCAARIGSLSIVRFLIEKGAKAGAISKNRMTPLNYTIERTKEGTTALDLAIKADNKDVIKILDQALRKIPSSSVKNVNIASPSGISLDNLS